MENGGSIDVVISNAGYGLLGSIEDIRCEVVFVCSNILVLITNWETPRSEELHAQFNANVYGVVRVIKGVLPFMRGQRSSTVGNISSIAGFVAGPAWGSSKGSESDTWGDSRDWTVCQHAAFPSVAAWNRLLSSNAGKVAGCTTELGCNEGNFSQYCCWLRVSNVDGELNISWEIRLSKNHSIIYCSFSSLLIFSTKVRRDKWHIGLIQQCIPKQKISSKSASFAPASPAKNYSTR